MNEPAARILKSAICRTAAKTISRPYPTLFYYPGLTSKKIHDAKSFPLYEKLKKSYSVILDDFNRLQSLGVKSDYDTSRDEHKLHEGSWLWNSYVLKGKRQSQFAVHCPKTVEILESIPGFMTGTPFSFAFFSSLTSNAKIAPHFGPCNIRLRVHFPLVVPDGDCGMQIGGEKILWNACEPVVFDDCYEHSVWNATSSDRTVLLFDIWHPELHPDEIESVQDMFKYAEEQGWLKNNGNTYNNSSTLIVDKKK